MPNKFSEGEFWSRFFNSKLFRRLRGDKISINNSRGDVILDKYLYIDQNYQEKASTAPQKEDNVDNKPANSLKKGRKSGFIEPPKFEEMVVPEPNISKFLDLLGNEQDNSQKLGNRPDITMRCDEAALNLFDKQKNQLLVMKMKWLY